METPLYPLSPRWERAVWRAHRGDRDRCWILILECGHAVTRQRIDLPPKRARCARCARGGTTSASEEVALPDLDATLSLVTTTGRPHGAPTDRVTLAITVTLGASWPPGTTPPPRWSKACLLPHASVELPAIRITGIDRMRSALLALRSTPSPAPEVPVSKKKPTPVLIDQLLAYCAGVENGPREGSIHLWLRTRDVPRVDAEALLSQLVEERRLERREKSVAGDLVVRYVVVDSSVEPAPLPRSDAPANDDSDPGDPEDDEGALDDPAAAFDEDPPEEACQRCASLTRERNALSEELGQGLGDALQRTAELAREVLELRRGHDDLRLRFCSALGLSAQVEWTAILDRVRDLRDEHAGAEGDNAKALVRAEALQEQLAVVKRERDEALREAQSLATQARPTVDGGTLASYLTRLTDDQWLVVQRGRAQLAEARDLRAKAAELEEEGTRTLEALLSEKPGQAPASPVEAPPVAAPSGETVREEEAPPPSEEGPRLPPAGTLQHDVLRLVIKRGKSDAETLAGKLRESKRRVSSALALLAKRGLLVRVATGLYEVAPTARRAA
jgi:hypothetical protein